MVKVKSPFAAAEKHLAKADPALKRIMDRVGPCAMEIDPDHFAVLVRAIISQQISTKAAVSITARVVEKCGKKGITRKTLAPLTDEELQACGLSTSKRKSIRGLVDRLLENPRYLTGISDLSEAEIAEKLLPFHGIGPWTVQMFLMFSAGKPDILPVGDLGIRLGIKKLYELAEIPTVQEMEERTAPWRPYRSIGSWFLWHSHDHPAK